MSAAVRAIVGLTLALGAQGLVAQVTTTGALRVAVTDEAGQPASGARVSARSDDTATTRVAVTDAEGLADLRALSPSARYEVTVESSGFATVRPGGVLVRAGQTASIVAELVPGSVSETMVVTAAPPVIDVRSAVVAEDITLDLTEAVPTGRSYQSYLQLVPGVLPDDPDSGGNPASRSGLNYRDIGGDAGVSRDNFYYIDGINVTDGVSGTFGANLNTEIIQEQQVLTGGIPAEYVGAPGLLSNVVTKSGSNRLAGSINYFFQNDGLVDENENAADQVFSRFDSAITAGGPIVRDKAWFFGSYRRLGQRDTVVALDGVGVIRAVREAQDQLYGRSTWSPTVSDTLVFTFLNDPTERSGSRDREVTNARDVRRLLGGDNYHVKYTRVLGDVLFEGAYSQHNGEVSAFAAAPGPSNSVIFREADIRTLEDEQLGAFGLNQLDLRGTEGYKGTAHWQARRHAIVGGVEWMRNTNLRNTVFDDGRYTSLVGSLAGITAGELIGGSYSDSRFDPTNSSDYNGFIGTVNALANRGEFYALYDLNGDGVISPTELAMGLVYASTAGNPHGAVNYDRVVQSALGARDLA